MINKLKQLLSHLTNTPIYVKDSLSMGDTEMILSGTIDNHKTRRKNKLTAKYCFKSNPELIYELDSIHRDHDKDIIYYNLIEVEKDERLTMSFKLIKSLMRRI